MDIRGDIEAWVVTASPDEAVEAIMGIVARVARQAVYHTVLTARYDGLNLVELDAIVAKAMEAP